MVRPTITEIDKRVNILEQKQVEIIGEFKTVLERIDGTFTKFTGDFHEFQLEMTKSLGNLDTNYQVLAEGGTKEFREFREKEYDPLKKKVEGISDKVNDKISMSKGIAWLVGIIFGALDLIIILQQIGIIKL